MLKFRGASNLSLDAKGRIVLPARYRERLAEICGSKLVVTIDTDEPCLLIYPLNEWEIVEEKINALQKTLSNQHAAITEVSDYFSVIELAGPQAREIIASASPFDTRTQHFVTGQCTQTRFGHASILLWPLEDTLSFGLQVRWSYAQYVYNYLDQSIANAESLKKFNQSR